MFPYRNVPKKIVDIIKSDFTFYLVVSILILSRIIICAKTEIVGMPYDTEVEAELAANGYWTMRISLFRPPVVPCLAYLLTFLAVPWRLFLDFCLVTTSGYMCCLLKKYTNKPLALCVLLLCLFNNYSIISFTEFQREPFLFIEYLLLFCCIMKFIFNRKDDGFDIVNSVIFSLTSAFIILTREGEEVFIAIGILVFSFIYVVKSYSKFGVPCLFRKISESVLAPVFFILLFCSATSIANYQIWGVPSYRGLFPYLSNFLTEVHHIESNDSSRYVPATRKSFEIAAQASAAFREFSAPILASDKDATPYITLLRAHSKTFTGRNEIDPSRTIWALNGMLESRYGANERLKAVKLAAAAHEVKENVKKDDAINAWVLLPYPFDSHVRNWIWAFPEGFLETARIMSVPTREEAGVRVLNDYKPELFDRALSRRDYLISGQFKSRMDIPRQHIASSYRKMLFALIFVSFFAGLFRNIDWDIVFISIVVFTFVFFRVFLYAIILTSVAPVLRYIVFFSPIFGILILLISNTAGNCMRQVVLLLCRHYEKTRNEGSKITSREPASDTFRALQ